MANVYIEWEDLKKLAPINTSVLQRLMDTFNVRLGDVSECIDDIANVVDVDDLPMWMPRDLTILLDEQFARVLQMIDREFSDRTASGSSRLHVGLTTADESDAYPGSPVPFVHFRVSGARVLSPAAVGIRDMLRLTDGTR